jgi:hypothetical protein
VVYQNRGFSPQSGELERRFCDSAFLDTRPLIPNPQPTVKTPLFLVLPIALLAAPRTIAQEAADGVSVSQQEVIIASGSEAEIPGEISDGKPSAPAPEPEPIELEVIQSHTKRVHVVEAPEMPGLPAPEGTISVTKLLVHARELPDPPPPLPQLEPDDPAVQARIAELMEKYHETQLVFVSATVYDHSRTYLRCYPSGNGHHKEIAAWSNLDFNHFSGFATYQTKGSDGETRQYGLLMGLGNMDTQQMSKWLAEHDREYKIPEIPKLPDLAVSGPAFVIVDGDTDDKEAVELIEGMHNLYKAEGPRMEEAYHARLKAYEERKAYLLANPPKPKDVTTWISEPRRTAPQNDNTSSKP